MKKLIILATLVVCIDLCFQRCANPGSPTGGPKDTIPPTLINSNPLTGTTNFTGQEITLEFSEYINADKLRQELLITPKTAITYKSIAKRNKLYIKLEEPLPDSITYNFNFSEGVTDITEKNPAINLSIAFSTGPYIDSLSIKGTVEELMSQKPAKDFVVGLYPLTDTLNYFTQNPMYFTSTDENGNYKINYIKSGIYKIISFEDDNGNLLLDPESEQHGFLEDTIRLDSSTILPPIRCILQNVKPIELINARPAGPYVEIKFNKTPDVYSITPNYLYHTITGDKKDVIRIFKPENINFNDSIESQITYSDSLGNQFIDTIKYVFLESNRKPSSFNATSRPAKIEWSDTLKIRYTFNKPIIQFDTTQFYIASDSIFNYILSKNKFKWNFNKTEVQSVFIVSPDSILKEYYQSLPIDTVNNDTASSTEKRPILRKNSGTNLKVVAEAGTFISIENDTSSVIETPLVEPKKNAGGTLNLSITTSYNSFEVQLVNESGKVQYSKKDKTTIVFRNIKPDTYQIRVLIDEDQDGKWSYGNLMKNAEPELIYLYPELTSIRENWTIDLGITF